MVATDLGGGCRCAFVGWPPTTGMSETDLLALVLAAVALLMFATGFILAT
jgi:hypothetical protein